MNKLIPLVFGIIVFNASQSGAQSSFDENVRDILADPSKGESYVIGYSQPLVTAFGTIMASGLFNRAVVQSFPHLDIGISYINLKIPQESKIISWDGGNVPTVFGTSTPPPGTIPGIGLSLFEIPQIQLNLGLTADIELMIRTWPMIKTPELGDIRLTGVGVKYGLSDLVTSAEFPIDLSVQATYHLLSLNNWVDAGTFAMNIHSSKDIPGIPIGIYTGFGYEVTSMTMRTDDLSEVGSNSIGDIKLRGQNGLRFIIGANLHLWIFTVHADYEIGYFNAWAAGVKIVI